jgi:serine-type D-Ala-D-Ala carboxypeptidase (penicillin-binding protein 5/6)
MDNERVPEPPREMQSPQESVREPHLMRSSMRFILGASVLILGALLCIVVVLLINPLEERSPDSMPSPDMAQRYDVGVFSDIILEAKAAYVYDLNHKTVLYEKNAQAQLPLASLTKIMTALIAAESLPYQTVVTLKPEDLSADGDNGLMSGESWSARDLLDFTLIVSSNDGARALATAAGALEDASEGVVNLSPREVFVGHMNEKARELNLEQTYFLNETGLDSTDEVSGGYGSAQDIVTLFGYALARLPNTFSATSYPELFFTSLDENVHTASNTNDVVAEVPNLIASKTGYTDLAGGNLVIAFDVGLNRPIIVAVLGSSREGRFKDAQTLFSTALRALQGGNQ